MKNKVRSTVSYLLLFLFIGYYGSITLFWHTHRQGTEIILHSHPFNNQGHTHTAAQYNLIKILSSTSGFIALAGLLLAKIYFRIGQPILPIPDRQNLQLYPLIWFRRGPPVDCLPL